MTTVSLQSTYVDLRCPIGPKRLLGKLRQQGEQARINSDNMLELACRDCKDELAKKTGNKPTLVVHRFNIIGDLVESEAFYE